MIRMYADGPRRPAPTRSRIKRARRQRSLSVLFVLSLLLFACVNDKTPNAGPLRDDASSSTERAAGDAHERTCGRPYIISYYVLNRAAPVRCGHVPRERAPAGRGWE